MIHKIKLTNGTILYLKESARHQEISIYCDRHDEGIEDSYWIATISMNGVTVSTNSGDACIMAVDELKPQ